MAYTKTNWVNGTTPLNETNLNKIEQGIYDNSLVVDAITNTLNPTDTETYKTAELTEGQITDVIGVNDIILKGNTKQQQYSGKNLLNGKYQNTVTQSGITLKHNNDNSFDITGTATSETNFGLITNIDQSNLVVGKTYYFYMSEKYDVTNLNVSLITNTPKLSYWIANIAHKIEENQKFNNIYLYIPSGVTMNYHNVKFMIVQGSTATSYEPYTGGIASPNPDYPQDIKVVTGDNKIIVSGKNLVPITAKSVKRNGVTFTINNNQLTINGTATGYIIFFLNNEIWSYSANNPILEAGTYNLSFNNEIKFSGNGGIAISIYNENSEIIYESARIKNNFSFSISEKGSCTIRMEIMKGQVFDNNDLQFQIEQGSTATTYEPHQGKELSLDLPVENLFDNTSERKSAFISTAIGSKVTYNSSAATYSYVRCAYLQSGKNYTISWTQSKTPASTNEKVGALIDENNIVLETMHTWGNNENSTIISPQNNGYLILGTDIYATNIQLEQGSKAHAYTPYGTEPIELCKIGDYQDYFYKSGSKWYLHKEINKITSYNGETITTSYISTTGELSTGAKVYYVVTPTDTKITDTTLISQLEAIYNAPLYEQTNITQTNNDLPMVLDITACKDNIKGIKAFIRKER